MSAKTKNHGKGEATVEAAAAAAVEVEPIAEPIVEPTAEAVVTEQTVEPVAEVATETVAEVTTEPVAETTIETVAEVTTEPVAETTIETVADVTTEPVAETTIETVADVAQVVEQPTVEAPVVRGGRRFYDANSLTEAQRAAAKHRAPLQAAKIPKDKQMMCAQLVLEAIETNGGVQMTCLQLEAIASKVYGFDPKGEKHGQLCFNQRDKPRGWARENGLHCEAGTAKGWKPSEDAMQRLRDYIAAGAQTIAEGAVCNTAE